MAAWKKTENEACILREVTDGLLKREIWIQANAEDDPRTLQKVDAGKKILTFDTLNRDRTAFFNGGNDNNLYQNICFDHV